MGGGVDKSHGVGITSGLSGGRSNQWFWGYSYENRARASRYDKPSAKCHKERLKSKLKR